MKLRQAVQLIYKLGHLAVGGDVLAGEGLARMALQDVAKAIESGKRRRGGFCQAFLKVSNSMKYTNNETPI